MEFVNFSIAKKLKEKGYPQVKKNTLAMYSEDGDWYSLAEYLDDFEYSFEDFDEHDYVCPTISQVLKWLREEKKLHISIEYEFTGTDEWDFEIRLIGDYRRWWGDLLYSSYEEAVLAGIEYTLDNLI